MVTTTEFDELLDVLRDFIRHEVMPAEAGIDSSDEIPAQLIAQAKEMGLYGYALPTEYGGLGLSVEQQVRVTIELGYTSPAFRSLFGTNNGIAGQVLVLAGTEEQRKQWLPRLASGEVVASFALTEPDAGSDPSRLVTSATADGDGWVIDGLKRYITNAPAADVFMVFARTDPQAPPGKGIGVFVVPAGTAGVAVAARDHKMGQAGAWTADVAFTGVRVPGDALVGEAAQAGYATAMRSLAHGRLVIAAMCVGVAARLVDESVGYARERTQGGHPIGEYQLVQAMLADSQTEYLAARALVLDAAVAVRRGHRPAAGPLGGEVLRQRGGRPDRRPRGPDPRRLRVHPRRPGRAAVPRRAAVPDLRGHQPDPATRHRPGDAPELIDRSSGPTNKGLTSLTFRDRGLVQCKDVRWGRGAAGGQLRRRTGEAGATRRERCAGRAIGRRLRPRPDPRRRGRRLQAGPGAGPRAVMDRPIGRAGAALGGHRPGRRVVSGPGRRPQARARRAGARC